MIGNDKQCCIVWLTSWNVHVVHKDHIIFIFFIIVIYVIVYIHEMVKSLLVSMDIYFIR